MFYHCQRTHSHQIDLGFDLKAKAMFTLYQIVKLSVEEAVPDKASVHTRNASFGIMFAPE